MIYVLMASKAGMGNTPLDENFWKIPSVETSKNT